MPFGPGAAGVPDEDVSTFGFSSAETDDFLERPLKLRGFRGDIRGTAGVRPATSGSLPNLQALVRHNQPSRSGSAADLGGSSAAAASTALGGASLGATLKGGTLGAALSRSKLHTAGDGGAVGGTFLSGTVGGGGSLLVERTRSMRLSSDQDRPGSPKLGLGPGGSIPTLEAELAELQLVAVRSFSGGGGPGSSASGHSSAEEAYEKLARLGEEDLFSLRLEQSFADQGGSDMQVLRICAHYAKHGLAVSRVARALNSGRPIGEVRRELDGIAIEKMQQVGESMATQPRDPNWASYGHGSAAAAAVASGTTGGSSSSSSAAIGSIARPPRRLVATASGGGGVADAATPIGGRPGRPGSVAADGLVRHACRMMKEQECLQDKARLYRIMDAEGPSSPMRRFIAGNIKERMRDEKDCEAEKMEVQQTCNNIRRQLTLMGNAQRDLKTLKRSLEAENREAVHKDIAKAVPFHKAN